MALAVLMCGVAVAQDYQWVFTDIDAVSGTWSAPEIALMPDGAVHVAYFSGTALKYAVRSSGGSWAYATAVSDANAGRRVSLAVDPQGNPRITWETQGTPYNPPVRYIEFTNGSWSSVMTVGNGEEPCIVLDSAGTVHLVYSNYYTSTPYKTHVPNTGTWQTGPALPVSFSWWPTIKINPTTNNPVVFCNPTDGYYFELNGNSWSSCFVTSDPGPGFGVDPHALVLAPGTGEPHVVWQDAAHNMKYARRTSLPCTWQTEPLGATGFTQALARTSAGDIFVLYTSDLGSAPFDLALARRDAATGEWTHSLVMSDAVDTSIPGADMVLDSEGNPTIVFSMKVGSQWKPVLAEVEPPACYDFVWAMGSQGSGPGQFAADLSPRGMVVVGDVLYVCDYGNSRVQRFDREDGTYLGEASVSWPTDIDYDATRQRFYVRNFGSVIAYDADFNFQWQTAIPTQSWVHYGLCVDSQGNIHTPSSYYPTIYVLNPAGQIIDEYPADGGGSVAIEACGGFIYTASGAGGVKKYTEAGQLIGTVIPPNGGPVFLACVCDDAMAVCFEAPQEVALFDTSSWEEECRFGGIGTGNGEFVGLQGIAADMCCNLYVSDATLHRVQRFNVDAPPSPLGDMNCDGAVDFDDINPFVLAIQSHAQYVQQFPCCDWLNGDCNGDGFVDFDDINPFVALLSGGG